MREANLDLLISGARVWSQGAILSGTDAVGVRGGQIVGLGPARSFEDVAGPATRRIDAMGGTLTPGLCDAHIHLVKWAISRRQLDLRGPASMGDALARVRAHATADGAPVIVGRGWDASHWREAPDRAALDAVVADRPVLLYAHDDHSLWVNTAALRGAGVGRDTQDPAGGRLERDGTGEPTGMVREHAVRLFAALEARAGAIDLETALSDAIQALHAHGVTSVHDFENAAAMRVLSALGRGDGPSVRVLMLLTHAGLDDALRSGLTSGIGNLDFRIGHVKLFADGTLGSRTAAMLEPYDDLDSTGMDLIPPAELRTLVSRAFEGGLSVAVHAIGDRAARAVLDAFEASRAHVASLAMPPRIEHVQILHPDDLPRFGRLGVVASMQPAHCVSDIDFAERRWGSRRARTYPWHSLLAHGTCLAFGSDAPVEPPDAALGIASALTRMRPDGTPPGGYVPAEAIGLDDALRAYTEGAARAAGTWPRTGRVAPGAPADLVVWNADLHGLAPTAISRARPRATVLAGRIVHESPAPNLTLEETRS